MDSENKFWVCMWGIIAVIVISITLTITCTYHYRMLGMAEKGYCETQGLGIERFLWQKCK